MNNNSLPGLSVSIVSFSPDIPLLRKTLAALRVALEYAHEQKSLGEVFCWLIDNGPGHAWKELNNKDAKQQSVNPSPFLCVFVVKNERGLGEHSERSS